jgi:hypothetical protein
MSTGQSVPASIASPITPQQCHTSHSPRQDERELSAAHSSLEKYCSGLTRAATAIVEPLLQA